MTPGTDPIIPCELSPETDKRIEAYVEALLRQAPAIGDHGLTEREFWDSGILRSAIERLRGRQAAALSVKRRFMEDILNALQRDGEISRWEFVGVGERHDYEIRMPDGRISVVETKGCLDGNNTNIFERPAQADEFVIWSLCQNPGADPRHNAWSGIHTRIGAEIIHRRQRVDGVVIWDMLCGTAGRPCPKLALSAARATVLQAGRKVPPPCIYLLPRSIPDPRNNPRPPSWSLADIRLLHALWRCFKGDESDVVEVRIEARMERANVQRRTKFFRLGREFSASEWVTIRRASR